MIGMPPVQAPRLLVVEDEAAIADSLLYVLRADGFSADHVLLGGDALSAHQQSAYDLILLDVGLPDITGLEVLRRLRAGGANVPVVFLTARSEELDRVLGLELGADDYVTKPFSPREVAARVRAILRRERRGQTACGSGPWRRDPEAMRISYYGAPLDLTRYEYGLLDLLLSHPERIFTREQIMSRVWADALDTTDRTVDAHIKTIRAKLKAIRVEDDPIRTHRGIGYSLAP
jgi:two-component system catabolic regulation response regulator CreB